MNLYKEGQLSKKSHRFHGKADNTAHNYNSRENIVDINSFRKTSLQKVKLLPKNLSQEAYIDALENTEKHIVFGIGPAGTGKTYLAALYAIKGLKEGTYNKIVIVRPNIAVDDRDIGFLPGNILEKMAPWTRPIIEIFEEYFSVKEIKYMIENNIIELLPLAHIRGRTLKKSIIILDEAQNTTKSSMLSCLTRIGDDSKLIITGDMNQSDRGHVNGLSDFLNRFTNSTKICICQFGKKDVERHPVIDEILSMYTDK